MSVLMLVGANNFFKIDLIRQSCDCSETLPEHTLQILSIAVPIKKSDLARYSGHH